MGSICGIREMEVRPLFSGLTAPGHFNFTPKTLPLTSASPWQLPTTIYSGESKVLSGRRVHSMDNTKIPLDAEKTAWKICV